MGWKRWIIVMLLPWVAGCSTLRLTYGQGPTLAYWWLDGYAEFSDEQAPKVKAALADWFAWHRATQLKDYAQALSTLRGLGVKQVTAAQVCAQIETWRERAHGAYDHAVPALATQVGTLSAEQIDHIERRFAERDKERAAEALQPDPAERHKAALGRAVDRAETLYGTLDDAQRANLAAALKASPFRAERWMAERRQRHAEIVRSLRQWLVERPDAATVQAGLRRLALEAMVSPREDYRAYESSVSKANCALMAQLHNSTTAAQRQHAVDALKDWETDLRALAAPP